MMVSEIWEAFEGSSIFAVSFALLTRFACTLNGPLDPGHKNIDAMEKVTDGYTSPFLGL